MPWWNPFSKKSRRKESLDHDSHNEISRQYDTQTHVDDVEPPVEETVPVEETIRKLITVFDYDSSCTPSDESRTADAAAKKLGQIGLPAVAPLIAELGHDVGHGNYRVSSHAVDALRHIGKPAVEPLIAVLDHPESVLRENAARALGFIADTQAVEPLIDALKKHGARREVTWALGQMRDPRAVEPLLEILRKNYPDGVSRHLGMFDSISEIAQALGVIGDQRAVEPLINLISSYYTCGPIVDALAEIGDVRAVEPLIALLNQSDEDYVRSIVQALGKLIDSRAVEPLIEMLKEKKAGYWYAVEALGKIGDARAVEPLLGAAKEGNRDAVKALAAIGDSSVLEPLLEIAVERNWDIHTDTDAILKLGLKNQDLLVSFLKKAVHTSKNIRVLRHAAEILVRVGESSVITNLPSIILDWLEFVPAYHDVGKDNGLSVMAESAGLKAELLKLASEALGYTLKTKSGRSSGGNYTWTSLDSYDGGMSAVSALCQRQDDWSSCILYRVSKKKDATVTMTTCLPSEYEVELSFEKERHAARQELIRRGLADQDPITQLQQ